MALSQVEDRMRCAIEQMSNASKIDEEVLNLCLEEISSALLDSDVDSNLVLKMKINVNKSILAARGEVEDKLKSIRKAIFEEVCNILDSEKAHASRSPRRGYASVVMFVGLQGCGKAAACAQYARHYQKKKYRPSIVLADSMNGSDRDLLISYAKEAKMLLYGSNCMESAPCEGIKKFEKGRINCQLIVVDTSDRHLQRATLFRQTHKLCREIKPDLLVYVLDSTIGPSAAFDEAQAFKKRFRDGAIILTKMDAHGSGLGVLSSVNSTKAPVIFIEKEHSDELEAFQIKPFVSRLLGMDELKPDTEKELDLTVACAMGLRLPHPQNEKYVKMKAILNALTKEELDFMNACDFSFLNSSYIIRISETCGLKVTEAVVALENCKKQARFIKMNREMISCIYSSD